MDFALNDEQRMIYGYGDELAKTYDYKYWLEKARAHEFPKELWQQVADDGFLGVMVPEEWGGAGLGMTEMALLAEGMGNNGLALLMMVVGPTMSMSHIATHGTLEQKQKYLPAACKGDITFCFAITEADAGSNSMKINTIAKPNGNRFSLSGSKTFITGVDVSDYALVVARTTPYSQVKKKTDGFTLFIVDLKAKGFEKNQVNISMPVPETQWTLFFDEMDLGPEDVIGEVDKGFSILFDTLNPERIVAAAVASGIGRFVLQRAVDYSSERNVFGAPIGSYQGLQHPMAKARTEIEMASLMARKAAWAFDAGLPAGEYANMAKYYAAEVTCDAVDIALQAHGGNGFTDEYGIYDYYPMIRLLRTAPVNRELILSYIGEHVMGMPRSY